jgi:hypothetical protein
MYYEYSVRQPKKIILTSNDPPEAYGNTMYVCPYCGICLPADNKNGSTKKYFTKHIKTKHPNRLELDTPKMHGTHKELKTEAPSLLLEKGYIQNQIFEEYPCYYGNSHTYKIDMVGIKSDYTIAVECGSTNPKKLNFLSTKYDEVIHMSYKYLLDKKCIKIIKRVVTN